MGNYNSLEKDDNGIFHIDFVGEENEDGTVDINVSFDSVFEEKVKKTKKWDELTDDRLQLFIIEAINSFIKHKEEEANK